MLQRDDHDTTGCFNMDCPGFEHVSGAIIVPGDAIQPVSDVPDGRISNITVSVLKVRVSCFVIHFILLLFLIKLY